MKERLLFFPQPFEDELFYSVLCRYYIRDCGRSMTKMRTDLFGTAYGQNLWLPHHLGTLASRLPENSGWTADFFIRNHTLYPYLKAFMLNENSEIIYNDMREAEDARRLNLISGIVGNSTVSYPRYLRYCPQCWREDIEKYGEAYWHRKHQLPGVRLCSSHGCFLMESQISLTIARNNYYHAHYLDIGNGTILKVAPDDHENALLYAENSSWLLEHGMELGNLNEVQERYRRCLSEKGYRTLRGRNALKKMKGDLYGYYSKTFMQGIPYHETQMEGTWLIGLHRKRVRQVFPPYFLLAIQFLCGTLELFFHEDWKEQLPYGEGPWPCRNHLCEGYLKDVIPAIQISWKQSKYHGEFRCPICGFTYRRKDSLPKEEQYHGYVSVTEYGWLWERRLKQYLAETELSISSIAKKMHCDYLTVYNFGIRYGFLEGNLRRRERPDKDKTSNRVSVIREDISSQQKKYRGRILKTLTDNPGIKRSALIDAEHEAYLWLRKNDLEWYEQNAPPALSSGVDWNSRDREMLQAITVAVENILLSDERPQWITYHRIQYDTGISQLKHKLSKGTLPLTEEYVLGHIETVEEWRKRKIRWAVEKINHDGYFPSISQIRAVASIGGKYFDKAYAEACVKEKK